MSSLVWLLFGLAIIGEPLALTGVLVLATTFSVYLWFSLKMTFWRDVSIDNGRIVVRGFFLKKAVAMAQVSRVWVVGGELLVELNGGDMLNVPAFEGSLLASVFGSPSASRAAEGINAHLPWAGGGGDDGRAEISRSTNFGLLKLPIIWAVSFATYWALSGFVGHF
ncbi:hypothetical protein [Nocardiopsis eucommiae]|uniref:hypothetical protein n=1 Tax=Nocardiopsis eucommiae TaxID=2831970 RepID=UPI003D7510A3